MTASRLFTVLTPLLTPLTLSGCFLFGGMAQPNAPAASPDTRAQALAGYEATDAAMDLEVDKQRDLLAEALVDIVDGEAELAKALKTKLPMEVIVPESRGLGGTPLAELSLTAQTRMRAGKAQPALQAVHQQVYALGYAAGKASAELHQSNLKAMVRITQLLESRSSTKLALDDGDYERVAIEMARVRRLETIVASSLATVAAYRVVVNDGGDPAALVQLASENRAALDEAPEVTTAEARAYVREFAMNAAKIKTKYVAAMKRSMGDDVYEVHFKTGIDSLFDMAAEVELVEDDGEQTPMAASDSMGLLGFAAGSPLMVSLDCIAAIRDGDAKGALTHALAMVPASPLVKEGVSMALDAFFPA